VFRPKRQLAQRRILITGASSGIGRALAFELAQHKSKLIVTARREDRLQAISDEVKSFGAEVVILAGDITDAEHRSALLAAAEREFGGLDILINNAGIGGIGTFASATESRLRQIMEVNFFAPMELIRIALPLLVASNDGVIVNVGSVLGHCAVPKKSEYCASKFAMHGITDALRMELADQNIDLLMISPSTTRSEFFTHALRSSGNAVINRNAMTPTRVARAIVRAMQVRRRETILSIGGKTLVAADRLFPGIMSRILQRFG